jgi:hypothetical protein
MLNGKEFLQFIEDIGYKYSSNRYVIHLRNENTKVVEIFHQKMLIYCTDSHTNSKDIFNSYDEIVKYIIDNKYYDRLIYRSYIIDTIIGDD